MQIFRLRGRASRESGVVTASAYLAHYQGERKHQGLGNRLLVLMEQIGGQSGSVRKRERLGGMLNYYFRLAG